MFNFATENKTTTAARPVPRKLNIKVMKEILNFIGLALGVIISMGLCAVAAYYILLADGANLTASNPFASTAVTLVALEIWVPLLFLGLYIWNVIEDKI